MTSENHQPQTEQFHLCEVVVDWEDGMSTEHLDEHKCTSEAAGKYEFETRGSTSESWLCENHRENFPVIRTITEVTADGI